MERELGVITIPFMAAKNPLKSVNIGGYIHQKMPYGAKPDFTP